MLEGLFAIFPLSGAHLGAIRGSCAVPSRRVGAVAAGLAMRLLQSLLFHLSPLDPATYAAPRPCCSEPARWRRACRRGGQHWRIRCGRCGASESLLRLS